MYILRGEGTYINMYIGKWGKGALRTTGELSGAAARTGGLMKIKQKEIKVEDSNVGNKKHIAHTQKKTR